MTEELMTNRLFEIKNAFDFSAENKQLFLESIKEMIEFHRHQSEMYDNICKQYNFSSQQLMTEEDIFNIPHIIVNAFKERKIIDIDEEEIVTTFTSSGTGGSKSQINWDAISRERQNLTRRRIVESYGLADYDSEVNYLVFSYSPEISGTRGAASAHSAYAGFTKSRDTYYAIKGGNDGNPVFDVEEVISKLDKFQESGLPLRITGFPAFSYVTLSKIRDRGKKYNFPSESVLFSGGGWKLQTGIAVSNDEYAALVLDVLGIQRTRIRDVFGMVEHGIPYMTDEKGRFRVPVYSRVCAVDPGSLEILPFGQSGMLKLITPYIRSAPSISILSTDLGAVHKLDNGEEGYYIELKGRGGVKKYAGCGISAAQLLGHV